MREEIEFRIPEKHASRCLPIGVGALLGDTVRKVQVQRADPLYAEIGRLDQKFRDAGKVFFTYANSRRTYSRGELQAAELFHAWAKKVFEPTGEECGTEYDESTACPECGAGATQLSDLRIDLRRVPRSVDFTETIAGEQIVSQRLAESWVEADLTGFELRPVRHKARYEDDPIDFQEVPSGREILRKAEVAGARHPTWNFWVWLNREENRAMADAAVDEYVALKQQHARRRAHTLPTWYQLVVTSTPVEIIPPTRAGGDPFDEQSRGRCVRGDVMGLNLLSEVTVSKASLSDADIMATRQMLGNRQGLLRPWRVLLLSPKAWRAIEDLGLKGFAIEVAHVAETRKGK
jgi:hypothetical protein